MENYYFVGQLDESRKILGFNLNEDEKNKLFYHIDKGDGHKGSDGRFYGSVEFKVEDEDELKGIFELRNFENHLDYSYVILSTENEWLASGFNETEKQVIETIREVEKNNHHVSFYVYEITGERLEIV